MVIRCILNFSILDKQKGELVVHNFGQQTPIQKKCSLYYESKITVCVISDSNGVNFRY